MFKLFSVLVLLFACANCLSHEEGKLMYKNTVRTAAEAVRQQGCRAHVCFALDTSGSVSEADFLLGRDFMIDITAILGTENQDGTQNPVRFAAGQYGERTYRISRMTGDVSAFNAAVNSAQFKHDSRTSVGSGIVWCTAQLRRARRNLVDTNVASKMVVIGDGRNNLGGDPVRRANNFRSRVPGSQVSAVTIGNPGVSGMATLNNVVGDNGSVFTVDDYYELSEKVEDLVKDICDITLDL